MSSDILHRIKRAVLAGNYAFSEKALLEMEADSLTEVDVAASILNHDHHALPDLWQRSNRAGLSRLDRRVSRPDLHPARAGLLRVSCLWGAGL
jgi:hypothetical protein